LIFPDRVGASPFPPRQRRQTKRPMQPPQAYLADALAAIHGWIAV